MRIRVLLCVERPTTIPINYQYQLSSAVYAFLERSDADYARFLHSEGYAPSEGLAHRRFKLFTFSLLRAQNTRLDTRQRGAEKLHLMPGPIEWQIASPLDKFVTEFASGLLGENVLRVGGALLPIRQVETVPPPDFNADLHCRCLSPIVAGVSESDATRRWTRYLRPKDPGWSEQVRLNALGKYSALHGHAPENTELSLTFDEQYLQTHRGTKLMRYKDIDILGAWCPLVLRGSPNLLEIVYNAGAGEKNAAGFGMVEVKERANESA